MLRVAVAQFNATVGDLTGNVERIIHCATEAKARGAQVLLTPELALCGYPPEDLLEFPGFISQVKAGLDRVVAVSASYHDLGIVLGAPAATGHSGGKPLFNAAAVLERRACPRPPQARP